MKLTNVLVWKTPYVDSAVVSCDSYVVPSNKENTRNESLVDTASTHATSGGRGRVFSIS